MIRRVRAGLWVWVLVLAIPAPASANDPLLPIKPWDMDYEEAQCTAMREYGRPEDPITLGIAPSINGETYQLFVAQKNKSYSAEEIPGSVDFGAQRIDAPVLKYGVPNGSVTVYQFRLNATEFASVGSAKTVVLRTRSGMSKEFTLEGMPGLMVAMQRCMADLRNYWNLDGEKTGLIKTPAKGNIRSEVRASDYPDQAIRQREQGTAQYLLMVDEKGSVAGCDVVKPSGVPVLDAIGCAVIEERTKMIPAADATGKPVRSTFLTPQISWKIEGG